MTVDFSFDDLGLAMGNGQIIDTEYFLNFTISSPDKGVSHLGPTIFDSSPAGPNAAGGDPDLLVDLGNILILQNSNLSANDGFFFDTPNDEADFDPTGSGTIVFDFTAPVLLQSIDLIDINGGALVDLVLTDGSGLTRTYNVDEMWSHDIFDTPTGMGFDTLDLTTLAVQVGEAGGTAMASEMAGFDANDVLSLEITFFGSSPSAAIDNLRFVPAPGSLVVLAAAGLVGRRRRRRVCA